MFRSSVQYIILCHIRLSWYPWTRSAPLFSAVAVWFYSQGRCSFEETVLQCNLRVCSIPCMEHHEGHLQAWQSNRKEEVASKAEGKEMTPGHCLKTGSVRPLVPSVFLSLLLSEMCFLWFRGTISRRLALYDSMKYLWGFGVKISDARTHAMELWTLIGIAPEYR